MRISSCLATERCRQHERRAHWRPQNELCSRALALGSEAHDLAQHFFSFAVDGSHGFPHNCGEDVVRSLEISVVLLVLGVLRVGFTRAGLLQVVLGEGAGDGHVDGESLAVLPVGDGHVAGAVGRVEGPPKRWPSPSQEKACVLVVYHVAQSVVAADEVSSP